MLEHVPWFAITGNVAFDYFFSIVFYMGLVAIVPGQIFKLLR